MAVDPKRVKELFMAVSEAAPGERAALLDRECAGDADLRQRVEALLQAHEEPASFLRKPRGEATAEYQPALGLQVGQTFAGRFKLREAIGQGGMGAVFVADQTEPVQRRVALKVIRAGADTARMLARFEQERQALALMDHPNIAKVLDAGIASEPGALATGVPYFVMELIKGVPLTQYCDEARLTPRQRLELFVPVCQAVQHAHQKGIIHRDLKPSNILVGLYDGKPVPKVIDFGVAKATGRQISEHSVYTEVGSVIGTLEYMSPEQAELNNLDIDTRSDIYALGAILYQLLTGTVPFSRKELEASGFAEMLRIIKEKEPPKPSTRLSASRELPSVAALRQTEPAKLSKLLRGELDWIVMKALEKDRNRRYETANGFAMDVQRYLAGEAVLAVPPSTAYRLRKFVRRNRVQVIAASLVLLALVAGMIGTTLGLVQANRATEAERVAKNDALEQKRLAELAAEEERRAKEREAERAEGERQAKLDADTKRQEAETNLAFAKKGNEILGSVFAGLDPRANYATVADLRDALRDNLNKAVKDLEGSAIGEPLEVAAMQDTLGRSLWGLGEASLAVEVFQKALATRKAKLGPDHPDTLNTMAGLAVGYRAAGQVAKAVPLLEETLDKAKAKLGPDHPDTLTHMNNLSLAYLHSGQVAKAVPLLEEALVKRKAKLGPDHPDTLTSMFSLAVAYRVSGQLAKAVPLLEQTLEKMKAKLGPDYPETLGSMTNLAMAYQFSGQVAKAVPLLEETLEKTKTTLGPDHPSTLQVMNILAGAYEANGQLAKAVPLFEQSLQKHKARLGSEHPETLATMANLGLVLLQQKKWAEAEPVLRDLLAGRQKQIPDSWQTFNTRSQLGGALLGQKRYTEAEPLLVKGYEGLKTREKTIPKQGGGELRIPEALDRLIELYTAINKPDEAKKWQTERAKYPKSGPPQEKK